jgi:hypothetical protein
VASGERVLVDFVEFHYCTTSDSDISDQKSDIRNQENTPPGEFVNEGRKTAAGAGKLREFRCCMNSAAGDS